MKTKRLQKWADALRKVNPDNFDIRKWVNGDYDELELVQEHACGTTACAAGYLPLIFPRSWKISEADNIILKAVKYKGKPGGRWTDDALMTWFEISHDDMSRIVYERQYDKHSRSITPNDVADRIEEIIAGG